MSPETSTHSTDQFPLHSQEEDALIVERQNFTLGCEEMERITDDIIVPVFQRLFYAIKEVDSNVDLILMDCESPLDDKLYNVGVRLSFTFEATEVDISIVADPSDFSFTLSLDGAQEEPITAEFKYHEVVPFILQQVIKQQLSEQFPAISYSPAQDANDLAFATHTSPFRILYDDAGNISDVATTKTLLEAASMGSTFAKMFHNEHAVSILDASGEKVC